MSTAAVRTHSPIPVYQPRSGGSGSSGTGAASTNNSRHSSPMPGTSGSGSGSTITSTSTLPPPHPSLPAHPGLHSTSRSTHTNSNSINTERPTPRSTSSPHLPFRPTSISTSTSMTPSPSLSSSYTPRIPSSSSIAEHNNTGIGRTKSGLRNEISRHSSAGPSSSSSGGSDKGEGRRGRDGAIRSRSRSPDNNKRTKSYDRRPAPRARSKSPSREKKLVIPTTTTTITTPEVMSMPIPKKSSSVHSGKRKSPEVEVEDGEVMEVTPEQRKKARTILDRLKKLPAPLPKKLPTKYLLKPNPPPSPLSKTTFGAYIASSQPSSNKTSFEKSSSCSSSEGTSTPRKRPKSEDGTVGLGLGLGLGLNIDHKSTKSPSFQPRRSSPSKINDGILNNHKSKMDQLSPELARSISQPTRLPSSSSITSGSGGTSKRIASPRPGIGTLLPRKSSGLRNSHSPGDDTTSEKERDSKESKEPKEWSREKWYSIGMIYRERALLLKRHGDAHKRVPTAKSELLYLEEDHLKGLLCWTDALLLWLYAYWCEENSRGKVKATPYLDSKSLREFVLHEWEKESRGEFTPSEGEKKEGSGDEGRKEMAKAMVGLMHLIEGVINYVMATEHLTYLKTRSNQVNGPSPPSTTTDTSASPMGPSPAPAPGSTSNSKESPATENGGYSIPQDVMELINQSASYSTRAGTFLLTSRHHLTLRLLRSRFPNTYDWAINSILADEPLPAPGDLLGPAKYVEIDDPKDFVWPIEFGMCAPVAHTAAFGRCLVKEMAELMGRKWDMIVE